MMKQFSCDGMIASSMSPSTWHKGLTKCFDEYENYINDML